MKCSEKIAFEELKNRLLEISQNNPKLRTSKKREHILRALYDLDRHLTPEEIYAEVKSKYEPEIGLATIYRSLIFFEEFGLINSIDIKDGVKRYELNCDIKHDHIICSECGRIDEFQNDTIQTLLKEVAQSKHYEFQSKNVKVFGLCPDCQS